MTRIAFLGDSAETGFGMVTREIGERLLKLGDDVRFYNVNVDGLPSPLSNRTYDLLRLSPVQMAAMLRGTFRDNWQPQVVLILADYLAAVQRVAASGDELRQAFYDLPILHYVPIEGRDLPNSWSEFWRYVMPVAITEFGAAEVERVTGRRPPVVYHGVNTAVFHPATTLHPIVLPNGKITSKAEAKRDIGLAPDNVVLLRTDRHMPRKRYNAMLRALGPLLAERDNVDLIIHCRSVDQGGMLNDSIRKMPRAAQGHVLLTNAHDTWRGLAPEKLAELYNASDIYLSTGAEGFGLTVAEAIACGVPAIGLDYSSLPEVIGPAGLLTPVAYEYDNEYDHRWAAPDEAAFREQVAYLVDHPEERARLGALGPKHVREHFRWDVAARQFHDLVKKYAA